MNLLVQNGQSRYRRRSFGAKNQFLFQMLKKGLDWPRVPNGQKHFCWPFWSILDPFGPLWVVDKPALFGHFWSIIDPFWASPVLNGGPQSKKKAHCQVSYVWPACRTPKFPVWNINMAAINIPWKNGCFCHFLVMNGKLWAERSFYSYLVPEMIWWKFHENRMLESAKTNLLLLTLTSWVKEARPFSGVPQKKTWWQPFGVQGLPKSGNPDLWSPK